MMPASYLLMSDLHFHNWSQFSTVDKNGVNSRLAQTLDEMDRIIGAYYKTSKQRNIFIAGDVFHVRGQIKPSVLNPVMEAFQAWCGEGFNFFIIPGNHDLEGKESNAMTNGVTALGSIDGVVVADKTRVFGNVVMIPWHSTIGSLTSEIQRFISTREETVSDMDLIIHAPLNDVIKGIPNIGLDPADLAKFGFRNVFAGHYHNHRAFPGNVYSIGALTHQTWNDVGSRCGALFVTDVDVTRLSTVSPKFVDFSDMEDPATEVKGNYVRIRGSEWSEKEIKEIRNLIEGYNPAGLVMQVTPKKKLITRSSGIKGVETLDESVQKFIKSKEEDYKSFKPEKLQEACAKILSAVKEVEEV